VKKALYQKKSCHHYIPRYCLINRSISSNLSHSLHKRLQLATQKPKTHTQTVNGMAQCFQATMHINKWKWILCQRFDHLQINITRIFHQLQQVIATKRLLHSEKFQQICWLQKEKDKHFHFSFSPKKVRVQTPN